MILSKDDPSNQIDISRQLFSVSKTGQVFHAKYGMGGNASTINLQPIDGRRIRRNSLSAGMSCSGTQ